LASLPRDASLRYAIVTVDDRGRFTDQSIVRAMGWGPGRRVETRVVSGVLVIQAKDGGLHALTPKGHVQLPTAVRQWFAMGAGDRVLLAAAPDRGVLVVHTMAALDAMLERYHGALAGGEPDERP
jgi:bifunctional DNA-binding transcriptional regulator/antitoxin component of YhaV-PrlF toxin-antitoxin module